MIFRRWTVFGIQLPLVLAPRTRPSSRRTASPAAWPWLSLTCLNSSRSIKISLQCRLEASRRPPRSVNFRLVRTPVRKSMSASLDRTSSWADRTKLMTRKASQNRKTMASTGVAVIQKVTLPADPGRRGPMLRAR